MNADKAFEEWYASIGVRTITDIESFVKEAWLASRKAALEEAAKVCGSVIVRGDIVTMELTARLCADAILALAGPSAGASRTRAG